VAGEELKEVLRKAGGDEVGVAAGFDDEDEDVRALWKFFGKRHRQRGRRPRRVGGSERTRSCFPATGVLISVPWGGGQVQGRR